ncbi:hypothetical protein N3K66_000116 [Trichothecium roseum]|uniref:Uncharacterized protein n=1 Tax=Trichothecium roseum TaxID=47278 RepID=A0ACC0VB19_9HYPO|nr:hypothetical protein N3K66_000116 [Trichothecium roseum]
MRASSLAAVASAATAAAALPSSASSSSETASSVDWTIPADLVSNPLFGAPEDDFTCRSAHNPVVLLHGLSANRDVGLSGLVRHLSDLGFCAYSPTYGAHALAPWVGGLRSMPDSAADLADYIRAVRDRTGSDKVDVVGHSEGGVMALYVPLTQPGVAEILGRTVSLGPAVHGAKYFGFTDLFYLGGEATRALAALAFDLLGCPACDDMATDGRVYDDFKAAGNNIVQPGVQATVVVSTSDALVQPEYSLVDQPGVRSVVVQDLCPDDAVGHAGLASDRGIWDIVVNELTGDYGGDVGCVQGLPF